MGILTEDMKRMIRQQRLGFIATVSPEGFPNLSPKGTMTVWGDNHLVFADLGSPDTIRNLVGNPVCEVNTVDYFARKGYLFKCEGEILTEGDLFDQVHQAVTANRSGRAYPSGRYVILRVNEASAMVSPGYSSGQSETEMRKQWTQYWEAVQSENS